MLNSMNLDNPHPPVTPDSADTSLDGRREPLKRETDIRLEARNLECVRDDRTLFSKLSFSVHPGEVVQVEGCNGSGKTSLLRILCGLSLPNEGEVLWRGEEIWSVRPEYYSELSYLGHAPGVKLELTPLENLRMARALKPSRDTIVLEEVLERVGLYGFEDVPARMLSAGQCRRVALARFLVLRSILWILDEPFTAIDKRGVKYVEALIAEHSRNGGMVILTTHHTARLDGCKVTNLHLNPLNP